MQFYYLSPNKYPNSFFFDAVSPVDIEREILSIPRNKTYGLYSCPIHILSGAKHIISGPLSNIFNISVQEGVFTSKLKQAKGVLSTKVTMKLNPEIIGLFRYYLFLIEYLKNWCTDN